MHTHPRFRDYQPDQLLLLPPDLRDWLPEDHLANFIGEVVDALDLSEITGSYDNSAGGQAPYHPKMMVKLLFYAYCMGVPSSRKIERNTYDVIPFRILSTDQHPDHDTIAEFRKRHLAALSRIFLQVLQLCEKAGLANLGHVALDGTKIKANASKHKAMSYERMEKKARELQEEVERLLAEAEATDKAEDAQYGRGKRGDELPEELRFRKRRLEKILAAKQALEEEAQAQARSAAGAVSGRGGAVSEVRPKPSAQRNFTDPDSRIMRDGASKAFEQSYNCQLAVDGKYQVIVACAVTQDSNDKQQVKPMVERMKANLGGRCPKRMTMDNGYYSDDNVAYLEGEKIDGYIATGRMQHGTEVPPVARGRIPKRLTVKQRMARKLRTVKGRRLYAKRKEVAEPVAGQIKEWRGFRRFLLRGRDNVFREFDLICLTENLLKIYRYGWEKALT